MLRRSGQLRRDTDEIVWMINGMIKGLVLRSYLRWAAWFVLGTSEAEP
jgi:hypothetical protein